MNFNSILRTNYDTMMNSIKLMAVTLIGSVGIASCGAGSADKKVPELATEMCNCFTGFQKGLSADGLEVLKAVAVAKDPQAEMKTGMGKLKPEDAIEFAKKIQSLGDKGSEVYACMEAFDKKHGKETTKNKTTLTKNLLAEMKAKGDCPVGAAIINLSLSKNK